MSDQKGSKFMTPEPYPGVRASIAAHVGGGAPPRPSQMGVATGLYFVFVPIADTKALHDPKYLIT